MAHEKAQFYEKSSFSIGLNAHKYNPPKNIDSH